MLNDEDRTQLSTKVPSWHDVVLRYCEVFLGCSRLGKLPFSVYQAYVSVATFVLRQLRISHPRGPRLKFSGDPMKPLRYLGTRTMKFET